MQRPPRSPDERLLTLRSLGSSLLQGASSLVVCISIFVVFRRDHGTDAARALTFLALVVSFLAIIVTNRSWSRSILGLLRVPNLAQWWVMGVATLFLVTALMSPPLQRLFQFAPLHVPDAVIAAVAGVLCVAWFEIIKGIYRAKNPAIYPTRQGPLQF